MIFGIDFGTSHCCMSYIDTENVTNNVKFINDENFKYLIPTQIEFYKTSDTILFGNNIVNSRDATVVSNFKRFIGNSTHVQTIELIYNNEAKQFTLNEILILFFKYLKNLICTKTNEQIKIVLTVPAYYTYEQRQIMQNVCNIVGIQLIRIINEPTAAALAYGIQYNKQQNDEDVQNANVLVLDSGGGTTDISLINIDYVLNIYDVITVFGDNELGGIDITNTILNYVLNKINVTNLTERKLAYITKQCELAKHCLCNGNNNVVIILEEINGRDYKIDLSYNQMINLNKSFFEKIKTYIEQVCFGYTIDKIVFVGGTTKIPYLKTVIQNELHTIFKNKIVKIESDIDPMTVVSVGASYQGLILTNINDINIDIDSELIESIKDITLFDVINQSIGIENDGGIMIPIIKKNTKIPCENSNVFTNSEDYIDTIDINVYIGERKFVKYNTFLNKLCLTNLDKTLKRGEMQIKVTFNINVDGLLTINAKDLKTKSDAQITIAYNMDNMDDQEQQEDEDFDLVLHDSMLVCKTQSKLELYECLKQMLYIYHTYHSDIEYMKNRVTKFKHIKMNQLFNWIFMIIVEYQRYDNVYLQLAKEYFVNVSHNVLLDYVPELEINGERYIADSTYLIN